MINHFHKWSKGDEEDSLQGRIISKMNRAGITLTAVAVLDTAVNSEGPFEVIEVNDGLELMVCIKESFILNLFGEAENEYARGYAFGVYIGSLLTSIYDNLERQDSLD